MYQHCSDDQSADDEGSLDQRSFDNFTNGHHIRADSACTQNDDSP
jgi:hypothetical protein